MWLSLFIGTQKVLKSHTIQKLSNGPDSSIKQKHWKSNSNHNSYRLLPRDLHPPFGAWSPAEVVGSSLLWDVPRGSLHQALLQPTELLQGIALYSPLSQF